MLIQTNRRVVQEIRSKKHLSNERCGWSHTCVVSFWFASPIITHQVDELVKLEQALWHEKETKWLEKATMYHFLHLVPTK